MKNLIEVDGPVTVDGKVTIVLTIEAAKDLKRVLDFPEKFKKTGLPEDVETLLTLLP